MKHPKAEVSLKKTGGGVFEIRVGDRLTYSKRKTGQFPTDTEIIAAVA